MVISIMLIVSCEAQVSFQIFESGTTDALVGRNPGELLTLDVVAKSITPNLDSFTYRISFPNEEFTLTANAFAAPFDNTPAPAGFNGSIPWAVLPVLITHNADAGSPGATPFVADVYRTTATTTGIPVTGQNVVLETLTVRIPSPAALPAVYSISLNVLEAADSTGFLLPTTSGTDLVLTVVRPVLHVVGFVGNRFTLELEAPPDDYIIEASDDLVHWNEIGSLSVGLTPATFTDPTSDLVGSRFYRARTTVTDNALKPTDRSEFDSRAQQMR